MTQQILQRESHSRTLGRVPRDKAHVVVPSAPAPARTLGGGRVSRVTGWFARLGRNFAPQDWYITAYFTIMALAVICGTGPGRAHSLSLVGTDAACLVVGLALTRGEVLKPGGFPSSLLYRFTVWLTVFCSYFQLRHILPAVSERAVDGDLLAFDLRVFHFEPSIAWDRFVTPVTTEWFAFFYFGYFFLLAAHVLTIMMASKSAFRLAHFALGIFLVFCTGHLVYMLVPGYGPYRYLAGTFQHELTGGPFWHAVQASVSAGGAQKDIFPSLHTGCPTYFALFSYRHRKALPYKYTWIVTSFCATQIIIATMFLRWHYLIDIFAGLTVATFAVTAGEALVVWDAKRRARLVDALGPGAVQANFELLDYGWAKRLLRIGRVAGHERVG